MLSVAVNAFDPIELVGLADRIEGRWNELESFELMEAMDRTRLAAFHESIKELTIPLILQINAEMRLTSGALKSDMMKTMQMLGPQHLPGRYEQLFKARLADNAVDAATLSYELALSTLLSLLVALQQDLPAKSQDGTYDRTFLDRPLDPAREHPYAVRNLRGVWERVRVALMDYLHARAELYQAHKLPVASHPPNLIVEVPILLGQLRRSYWSENLVCHTFALALLRMAVVGTFSLLEELGPEMVDALSTSRLVESLFLAGFTPFPSVEAFVQLTWLMESHAWRGLFPTNTDQYSFVLLTEEFVASLAGPRPGDLTFKIVSVLKQSLKNDAEQVAETQE